MDVGQRKEDRNCKLGLREREESIWGGRRDSDSKGGEHKGGSM